MNATSRPASIGDFSPAGRRLLALLAAEHGYSGSTLRPELARADRDRARLSFAQERLWFLDQFQPGLTIYNMPLIIRIPAPPDPAALERALGEIVDRHAVLRTTFPSEAGKPIQRIALPGPLTLAWTDLRPLPADERQARFRQLVEAEWEHVFDLEHGPLFRAQLVSLDDGEHQLLVNLHHIVCDGWSLGILMREIATLYGCHLRGAPSPLPALQLQYADFAEEQRARLAGDELDRHLAYWRDQLAGAPPTIRLPTDRPRPPVQTFRGALQFFHIPDEISRGLAQLERRLKVTLFMVLLTTFKILLYRYTGQDDLVLGTPIANRNRPEIEGLIGFFTNTVALRTRIDERDSFETLVARVRETTLDAYAHQDLPFEMLVQELQPERSLAHNPLFQVMFALQSEAKASRRRAPTAAAGESGEDADRYAPAFARFDLAIFLAESESGLAGEIEYNTDLFDHERITRLAGHFQTLLAGIADDPAAPIAALPLLGEEERRQLLWEPNAAAARPVPEENVHELIEARAAARPGATALIFGESRLSYGELNQRANRLARELRRRGARRGERVGVCLDRSFELIVAILAVWKAGAAYLALDPTYPAERLAFMAADAGARFLVSDAALIGRLPVDGAEAILIDRDGSEIARQDGGDLSVPSEAGDTAYIVYTSGSTGRPKGIAMPHSTLANLIAWHEAGWAAEDAPVVLHYAALGFDVSIQEAATTLAAGGALVLVPEDLRADFEALVDVAAAQKVTRLFLPPVALRQFADAAVKRDIPLSLREVIAAGEQLEISAEIRAFFARMPAPLLRNQYGPAETHAVSELVLDGDPALWPSRPGIGRPIANARLYILDERLEPVAAGLFGELYIGGLPLAHGYVGRPALTAERFLPDPHAILPGARMYRSGDRARLGAGGCIEFAGRLDRQVKIRGFRIEPGEIEAVLARHENVRQAVVASRPGAAGGRSLVVYFVAVSGRDPSPAELRDHLASALPDFMIPSAFVRLDALPLLRNGKIDFAALPEPDAMDAARAGRFEAPADTAESTIVAIWQEVLGMDRIGTNENFFELGGHSLLATQIISRIRSAFGIELPLRAIFEAPTVRGLAIASREARASQGAA